MPSNLLLIDFSRAPCVLIIKFFSSRSLKQIFPAYLLSNQLPKFSCNGQSCKRLSQMRYEFISCIAAACYQRSANLHTFIVSIKVNYYYFQKNEILWRRNFFLRVMEKIRRAKSKIRLKEQKKKTIKKKKGKKKVRQIKKEVSKETTAVVAVVSFQAESIKKK